MDLPIDDNNNHHLISRPSQSIYIYIQTNREIKSTQLLGTDRFVPTRSIKRAGFSNPWKEKEKKGKTFKKRETYVRDGLVDVAIKLIGRLGNISAGDHSRRG